MLGLDSEPEDKPDEAVEETGAAGAIALKLLGPNNHINTRGAQMRPEGRDVCRPKPKKIPMRMCLGCREMKPKTRDGAHSPLARGRDCAGQGGARARQRRVVSATIPNALKRR